MKFSELCREAVNALGGLLCRAHAKMKRFQNGSYAERPRRLLTISVGMIGVEDWRMYPLVPPQSLVRIDPTRRKIINSGWSSEFDRPIYMLEHKDGYICSWCTVSDDALVVQPHPASLCPPEVFQYPDGIEVIGTVTGAAIDFHTTHSGMSRRRS